MRELVLGALPYLAALGLGLWAYDAHMDEAEAVARAEKADSVAEATLERALAAETVAARMGLRADPALEALTLASERADSLDRALAASVEDASAEAVAAGEDISETFDSIEVVLEVVHRPLVDTARAQVAKIQRSRETIANAFQRQQAEFVAFRTRVDSTLAVLTEARDAERRAKESWRDTALSEREAKEEWRAAANPGFFGWLSSDLPRVAAVFGAGALAGLVW